MGTRKALKDWVCHFNFRWWVNHFRSWLYYFRFDPNFRWKQMFKGQISWNSRQGNFSVVFDVFFLSAEFQTEPLVPFSHLPSNYPRNKRRWLEVLFEIQSEKSIRQNLREKFDFISITTPSGISGLAIPWISNRTCLFTDLFLHKNWIELEIVDVLPEVESGESAMKNLIKRKFTIKKRNPVTIRSMGYQLIQY